MQFFFYQTNSTNVHCNQGKASESVPFQKKNKNKQWKVEEVIIPKMTTLYF